MYRKCDRCQKKATHHSIEIVNGEKIEKHLCDEHAAEDGLAIQSMNAPINELLTNFVKVHGGGADAADEAEPTPTPSKPAPCCDVCGLSWPEFRKDSLLGCPHCYESFEEGLSPLLERAHEGAANHIGKVPTRAGAGDEQRQVQLSHMRQRLDDAVVSEDYELAARLRDDIRKIETEGQPSP